VTSPNPPLNGPILKADLAEVCVLFTEFSIDMNVLKYGSVYNVGNIARLSGWIDAALNYCLRSIGHLADRNRIVQGPSPIAYTWSMR
jgi:hypothetical protein